jgi:hypothetical protein
MASKGTDAEAKRPHGKKVERVLFAVTCRNDRIISGRTNVRFDVIAHWGPDELLAPILEAARRVAQSYATPVRLYQIRSILRYWAEIEPDGTRLLNGTVGNFVASLARLRQSYFAHKFSIGNSLSTTSSDWNSFLCFLRELNALRAFPIVDLSSPRITTPPASLVAIPRSQIKLRPESLSLAPRNYRQDLDSYNEELFEDLSIGADSVSYLEEYQARLSLAINSIRAAALADFEGYERRYANAKKLIEKVEPLVLSTGLGESILPRNVEELDEETKRGFLLWMVERRMGGIPRPWSSGNELSYLRPRGYPSRDSDELSKFGKNLLLPELGILTPTSALICVILIMIEHPSITVSSILRAELHSEDGKRQLLTECLVGGNKTVRLTVLKARAKKETSVILTPLAARVLSRVLDWTRAAREDLVKRGELMQSRRLWVGMSLRDYRIVALSPSRIACSVRFGPRTLGATPHPERLEDFVTRHPELAPWADRLNLKSLRKNLGVLHYLRSEGDLVSTAQTLGHKSVATTIESYIPHALRMAIYERQIRRHQNLLIAAACAKRGPALEATDFRSTEELHTFLAGIFAEDAAAASPTDSIRLAVEWFLGRRQQPLPEGADQPVCEGERVVLSNDPHAFAVAMLYAEHVKAASTVFLDRPDLATGVAPRFWTEFVRCLDGDLPHAMSDVQVLVQQSKKLTAKLAGGIQFPPIA